MRINRVYPFQLVTIIKHSSVAKIGIYQKLNVALTHEKYLYTDLSVVSHCQLKRSGVNNDVSILCGWKHMATKNAALNSNVAFIGKFKKNLLEIKPRRNVAVISTKIGMKRRDTTNKKKRFYGIFGHTQRGIYKRMGYICANALRVSAWALLSVMEATVSIWRVCIHSPPRFTI